MPDVAVRIFEQLDRLGVVPETETYNAVGTLPSSHGEITHSSLMQGRDGYVAAGRRGRLQLLHCFRRPKDKPHALTYYARMQADISSVPPDLVTYNIMLKYAEIS